MVNAHQRRAGACPQAGVEPERYLIVLSLPLALKAQLIQNLRDDVGRAFQVTGGTPADLDDMLGWGLETEVSVEGGYTPDVVDAGALEGGDLFYNLVGEMPKLVLGREQRREDGHRGLFLPLEDLPDPMFKPLCSSLRHRVPGRL